MTGATQKTAERRRHPRMHLRMDLRCVRLDPHEGDVIDRIHMLDVSRGGIGAVTDRDYYPGQRVVLCLPPANGRGKRHVYATIRRCRFDREGDYRLGLEFDNLSLGNWCGVSSEALAVA